MSSRKNQPAAPTAAKHTDATSMSQDGNAAYVENSIVGELARIADELHVLNKSLTLTRNDGTTLVGLAHLIAEIGNGRVRR